ncbi:hypothetical protein HY495_00760 [Candidatus Woesearchaeota archaeon]|nr:hypothetical protein [Candidatus Woesearchaeota archaeon]
MVRNNTITPVNRKKKQNFLRAQALFVIMLFVLLPAAAALEISAVSAQPVTSTGATISWTTDEPADSFVHYGTDAASLKTAGDAKATTSHSLQISGLAAETKYLYSVESQGVVDDNGGSLYSFETPAPDTAAPALKVEFPAKVAGTRGTFSGETEIGVQVTLILNGKKSGTVTAEPSTVDAKKGFFTFSEIILQENAANTLLVEAVDAAGNKAAASGSVFADAKKPTVDVKSIPAFVTENSYKLMLTVSEAVKYEIFVNNKSVSKGEGAKIDVSVPLQEGQNKIVLKLTDDAGWVTEEEITIEASAKPPMIKAEIERGKEFYEGRATSPISGTTSPGAKVYLYVYKPQLNEYTPSFDRPRQTVTANEKGEFRFADISFTSSIADISLEKVVPKEIPADLVKIKIFPLGEGVQQQTYYVYLIAEDKAGRSASWQQQVLIQSCFSGNLDFSIESVPEFQAPLRLVPQLVDQGRQDVQAVFKLNYNGLGVPVRTADGKIIEQGVRVTNVQIGEACTTGMAKDEKFSLGCSLLPSRPTRSLPNPDQSAVYASWTLHQGEELSAAKESFWNEFKNRQVVFPLKIQVSYQEVESRDAAGNAVYGKAKIQNSCTDLSYFVDIPLDSKDMIPDFLADEGVDALNWTITQINVVTPYIEKAYLITGITGMAAFLLRTVARWVRIFATKLEQYYSILNKNETGCRNPEQYYLDDTLKDWKEAGVANGPDPLLGALKSEQGSEAWNAVSLDKRCPSTASAWKFEAIMDQAYKWSWDRAFCRAVPARWTEDKKQSEIALRVADQQQCAVTGSGVPLELIENCKEFISKNKILLDTGIDQDTLSLCWRTKDSDLYVRTPQVDLTTAEQGDQAKGFYYLTHIGNTYTVASSALITYGPRLKVYKPQGAQTFFVAKDQTCTATCNNPQKPGYQADRTLGNANGCYDQKGGLFYDGFGDPLLQGRYAAGYTKDCFIKDDNQKNILRDAAGNPQLQQCVCMPDTTPKKIADGGGMRVAQEKNKDTGVVESWSYQQDRMYQETGGGQGTFYPAERYSGGRDLSGAFGANYLLDYARAEEKEPKINPNTQIIGTFQTVCLSGILKNLKLLQSMLAGVQACLVEAKYTGLHDAGMCKTLFTQQVCGLLYQGIAFLASSNSCMPLDFNSVGKEGPIADAGTIISGGFSAMTQALDTSFEDARNEYGNAALNQYFKGGTQGFAQSICLAAFGYDFPLFSEDFLLDAAYAFPTKTFPVIAPASRELSSYDPTKQMAIFNYNIGGAIFPGCKVKTATVKLKCIGPGDRGNPNVDESCGGQGCDCLNVPGTGAAFEAQKEQQLGTWFNLPPAQMFSIPLESPQHVTAPYRYDHVVVELFLDPSEKDNYDKCVESEFLQGNKAVFYYPLSDVSPPSALACTVDLTTGRYQCPELYSLFGYGGAFLEDPYVSCWNKKTETWMSCDTPNLFVIGDEIKVRAHVNTDGKGQCLKRTVNPLVPGILAEAPPRQIVQNVQGAQYVSDTLGIVQAGMFGGSTPIITLAKEESGLNCGPITQDLTPTALTSGEKVTFGFDAGSLPNTVRLIVPATVNINTPGYSRSGNYLAKGSVVDLAVQEINLVQFSALGFTFRNVLGGVNPTDQKRQCVYQIIEQNVYSQGVNSRDFTVTYQLLEKDEAGGCYLANQPVKTSLGKATHGQKITIQKEETAVSGLQQSFATGNYQQTLDYAVIVLNQRRGDMENALAYYYYIASFVMLGKNNPAQFEGQIKEALSGFFNRKWAEQDAQPYPADVAAITEYQKIRKYLCEVDGKYGSVNAGMCGGGAVSPSSSSSATCEGKGFTIDIGDGFLHRCLSTTRAEGCRPSTGLPTNEYDISKVPTPAHKQKLEEACKEGATGGTFTATVTLPDSSNKCSSGDYPINDLPGDNAPYAFRCDGQTKAYSCTKSTGDTSPGSGPQPFTIPASSADLLARCKS